ncbi:MAG: ABC transporter ATP-binding protein, partial [Phycisphaerales bacterium]|nr:ABC transporter ATP-binding protein [Phycisphaerales bacterium]
MTASPAAVPPTTTDAHAGAILTAHAVHKTYRLGRVRVPVLRGASIEVRRGEWVAILGASGSGKSTLLHLLGGLDRPDPGSAGRVMFEGRDLNDRSAGEIDRYRGRSVGFVFQFYHLLPELTALENVLVASMAGLGRAEHRRRRDECRAHAQELLRAFGLGERLAHRPNELSGGERQRVAIARALVNRPAVLLADESTGNL